MGRSYFDKKAKELMSQQQRPGKRNLAEYRGVSYYMRLKPQVPLTLDWFKLKLDEETLLVLIESECFLPSDIWERSVD